MKIFHLFLLSVLISPACIFAQDKNRLEETNQVTGCRLQGTGLKTVELPLENQIRQRSNTTTNCDNSSLDLSYHLSMDPAELKNIKEGVDALRGVITTERTVAEGEVAEASSVRARGNDVASDVNCCELSIYSPSSTSASLNTDYQIAQENVAEQYKVAADYEREASEAHHLGKEDERNSWALAGKSAHASADYQAKAIEAEAVGKITLAASYRDVAAISQRAADQWKLSAERKAARKMSEAYSWGNAGMSLQSQADYQAKAIEAEEAGKITLAAGYREAAATFQRAAEQNKLTAETYIAGKISEAYSWGKEAESLRLKAGYQAKACEAEEAGKTMLVAGYREAVVISQRAADQWKLSAETEIAGKEIESNSWGREGGSLQKQADYQVKAIEAQEAGKTDLAAGSREAATIFQRAAIQHRKSAQAYATGKKDEGGSWERVGKFLQAVADYQVKACEAQEAGKMTLAVGYCEAIEILQKAAEYHQQVAEAVALGKKDESDGWYNVAMFLESKAYDRIRRAHADEIKGVAGIQNVSVQRYSNSIDFSPTSTSAVNCFVAPVLKASSSFCTLNFSAPSAPCTSLAVASFERSLIKRIALSLCCEKWLAETKSAEGSNKILSDYVIDALKRGANHGLVKDFEKYWSYVAKAHELGDDPQALAWIQVAEDVQQAIEASIEETASRNNIELNEAWCATIRAMWIMIECREEYIQNPMYSQSSDIVNLWKKLLGQSQYIVEYYRKAAEACSLGNEQEPNRYNSATNSMEESAGKVRMAVAVLKQSTEERVAGNILLADGYIVEAKKLEHAAELMIQSSQAYVEGREYEGISLSWAGKYTGESSTIMIKAIEAQGIGNSILEVEQITKAKGLEQEAERYRKAATVRTRIQEAKEKESASIGAISSTLNEVANSLEKATEYWDKAMEACRFNKTPMGEKYIVVAEKYEQAADKYGQAAKIRTKGTWLTGVEEIEREGKALEEEAEAMIQKIEEKSVPIPPTSPMVEENWGGEID